MIAVEIGDLISLPHRYTLTIWADPAVSAATGLDQIVLPEDASLLIFSSQAARVIIYGELSAGKGTRRTS